MQKMTLTLDRPRSQLALSATSVSVVTVCVCVCGSLGAIGYSISVPLEPCQKQTVYNKTIITTQP